MKSIKTNQIFYLMQSTIEPSLVYLGVCSLNRNPVTAFKYVARDMQIDANEFKLVKVDTYKDKIYNYVIDTLENNGIKPKFINRQFTAQHEYNLIKDFEEMNRLI